MTIESQFTLFTHYIEIDEHSEKDVRNRVSSLGSQGVSEEEEKLIQEITRRIRDQLG